MSVPQNSFELKCFFGADQENFIDEILRASIKNKDGVIGFTKIELANADKIEYTIGFVSHYSIYRFGYNQGANIAKLLKII